LTASRSAFAPDFKELDENVDYEERESEFDLEDEDKSVQMNEEHKDVDVEVSWVVLSNFLRKSGANPTTFEFTATTPAL
jgi:uncharacterized protein YajQ (UPF0234 family)